MSSSWTHVTFSLPLALLMMGSSTPPTVHAQCTVCLDGSTPNGVFGNTDCALIAEYIGMTPETDAECTMTRLEGFQDCECPTFPDAYCSMCSYPEEDSAYEPLSRAHRGQSVPIFNDLTCEEAEFLLSDNAFCDSLSQAAWFCGCPNNTASEIVRGDCYLCTDEREPNERKLPPTFEKNCREIDREGGLYYNADGSCEDVLLGQEVATQIDYETYCACVDSETPVDTCSLCGANATLLNPDGVVVAGTGMTCTEMETLTRFVLDGDYCMSLQTDHAQFCCNVPQPTTEAPVTPFPSASETSAPVVPMPTVSPVATETPNAREAATTSSAPWNRSSSTTASGILLVGMSSLLLFVDL